MTVDLSSLDFSRNETAAGSVDVTFGGQVLATQAVDRVYTPTLDEIGKATVTFAIPAGTSGPTPVRRLGPSHGHDELVPAQRGLSLRVSGHPASAGSGVTRAAASANG